MTILAIAAATWVLLHVLVAGALRPALVARLGEHPFRGLFSVLSAVSLGFLIWAYRGTPFVPLWDFGIGALHLAKLLVFIAVFLLVGSLTPRNPNLAGADFMLKDQLPAEGMIRVTRHPMLWAFTFWAIAHLLANGHLAALLLFGAILVTALNGMYSIDRKQRRRHGAAWDAFAAKTSLVPFLAIIQGRNQFVFREFGLARVAIACALFLILLYGHGTVIGRVITG
jgi:uncharacterized membrane protein